MFFTKTLWIKEEIHKVSEMIELPLRHPEIFEKPGIEAGKTLLAKAVTNQT